MKRLLGAVNGWRAASMRNRNGHHAWVPPPVQLQQDELIRACKTIPTQTGLGWDAIHPRAIPRLSAEVLRRMVLLLLQFELNGSWPTPVGVCIVVLLPKADGGFRPIGLLPWSIRVWTRARREAVARWESAVQRPFLYAGKGMGADIVAWKQLRLVN